MIIEIILFMIAFELLLLTSSAFGIFVSFIFFQKKEQKKEVASAEVDKKDRDAAIKFQEQFTNMMNYDGREQRNED